MELGLSTGWLPDFKALVGGNVSKDLHDTTGPAYFNLFDSRLFAQSEVYAEMAGGCVADRGSHFVVLLPDTNTGADSIPITAGSNQLEDDPIVLVGADVLPQLGGVLK